MTAEPADDERGLVSQVGPIEVDWPGSIGYFGAVMLATAFELIEPPLAVFIAAVPFIKMFTSPGTKRPVRLVSQLVDGASKPIGGDGEHTVRLRSKKSLPPAARGK